MKKLISFLSYNNAVPIVLGVLFLGGASAFAATATGVLNAPAVFAPNKVDASALLSADLNVLNFRPTVLGIIETDSAYTISYSIETLELQGNTWAPYIKMGEFSVSKSALDDTGIQGRIVQRLQDLKNGERAYLARAQAVEKELAVAGATSAEPASALSWLIGLTLDQISVPVAEKLAPEPQPEPILVPLFEKPAPEPVQQSEQEPQPEAPQPKQEQQPELQPEQVLTQ